MSGPQPVVGVVGHGHLVPRDFGDLPVTGTPPAYLESVVAAGGRAVILPPGQAAGMLDLVDAIVLTGGADLDADADRDAAEFAVVHAAANARVPLLGICRGHQVMAAAFGGTLADHVDGHLLPGQGHGVRTAPDSLVHRLLGPRVRTSALHHQAVLDPGPSWRATAWTDDGTVEAIEPSSGGWAALGVQWHPELFTHPFLGDGTGPALFAWLVDAAVRSQHTTLPPQGSDPWKRTPQNV